MVLKLAGVYDSITNRFTRQHEEASEDMPLHRAIKDQGSANFSFEVIKTVEYIDNEPFLIIEKVAIWIYMIALPTDLTQNAMWTCLIYITRLSSFHVYNNILF